MKVLHNSADKYEAHEYRFKDFERSGGPPQSAVPSLHPVPTPYRGGGYEVSFWCETCPHAWKETHLFHKGNIFIEQKSLSDSERRELGIPSYSVSIAV
tara:strand:+ start:1089 stop:1382 length:294 start_codon:yes stop_codon:yes gene_type:complete